MCRTKTTNAFLVQLAVVTALFVATRREVRSFSSIAVRIAPPPGCCCRRRQTTGLLAIATSLRSSSSGDNDTGSSREKEEIKPDILQPFLPASNPRYMCEGTIGDKEFVVSREGGPAAEELANENLIKIVRSECSDLEANTLMWKCLGYRFDPETKEWNNDEVFPKWKEKYPAPPDMIGMQRIYSKEVDQPSLRANQSVVRSIPVEHKQSLKKNFKPMGWSGYKYAELTPNKTRRAQVANWLLFYRDELFGYTVEELRERREQRKKQQQELEAANKGTKGDDWKPPVKEVF